MEAGAPPAETHHEKTGEYPTGLDHLYAVWLERHPAESEPRDPFDGERYGYSSRAGEFVIWSTGPDRQFTEVDLRRMLKRNAARTRSRRDR